MGIYEVVGLIVTKQQQQNLKEEMKSQKKQTDVRSECEDSIEFADRKKLYIDGLGNWHYVDDNAIMC